MSNLEKRLEAIEQRNQKVELDKSWETSFTRKIIITGLTYLTITLFLFVAQLPNPFINSIVPTAGFVLLLYHCHLSKRFGLSTKLKNN